MAGTWKPDAAAKRLVKGLDARLRDAGDQWLVKSAGKTVASVRIRKNFVRIDLKVAVPAKEAPKGIVYVTKAKVSKSWPGGGVAVTEETEEEGRTLLEAAVAKD